jgi:hypothetical protein
MKGYRIIEILYNIIIIKINSFYYKFFKCAQKTNTTILCT